MNKCAKIGRSIVGLIVTIGVVVFMGASAKADFSFVNLRNLGPGVNGPGFETAAGISADGLSFYFVRDQVESWVSRRATQHDDWPNAQFLGMLFPNSISTTVSSLDPIATVTTADGLEAYYSAELAGGYGRRDTWAMTRDTRDSDWGPLVNICSPVNSAYDEHLACVSPDGLELYFSGRLTDGIRPGGYGKADLWVARRVARHAPWAEPVNLGPVVNSVDTDARPSISPDGLILFFDSSRPGGFGGLDLYMTRRATLADPWGVPVNLGPLVNTDAVEEAARISADGLTLYWDSDRTGANGDNDLWQVSIVPKVDLNNDGHVDSQDMSVVIDHWHTSDPLCDIGPTPLGDGIVDFQDLKVLSEYLEPGFGRSSHWKLDEAEGDIAYDSVGSDHANIHAGAEWQPSGGVIEGALMFDGVDDYIAPMTILNPQDKPFRILAWVKDGAPGQVVASQTPDEFQPGSAYLAADPADGTLMTRLLFSNMPLDSEIVIADNEWHEVGIEWDGERRHLVVNGEEVAVDEMSLPALECTGYLNIGTGPNNEPGSFWAGLIDEVRVYQKGR